MQLLTRNSKIKKSKKRTFNFGIPAFKSASGMFTCPNAGACAKGCYALAGAYRFSNVAKTFEARLAVTLSNDFVDAMLKEIDDCRAERIRIHDSGDFYSEEYLDKWIKIMIASPNVEFYAYTKMVSMFKKRLNSLPKNFKLVFSFGGTEDKLIDVSKDRHSLVFENEGMPMHPSKTILH
jgi:Gene product 88